MACESGVRHLSWWWRLPGRPSPSSLLLFPASKPPAVHVNPEPTSSATMSDHEEEHTIAEDLVVTKYKMAGEIVNRKSQEGETAVIGKSAVQARILDRALMGVWCGFQC